jgi:hypothetical protein
MASAEEYAKWIVENADKKGTPEFETVAQAYQLAKTQAAPSAPEEPSKEYSFKDAMAGSALAAGRGLMTGGPLGMATGMIGEGNRQIDKAAYSTGGKVTDLTGSPELGFAANVGMQAVPAILGGEAAKAIASPAFEAAAKGLMHSALKPPSQALVGGAKSDAAKAIQTMLDEGVNVSPRGAAQLREMINKLKGEVAERIAKSTGTVDKGYAMSEISKTLDKFKQQVNPKADLATIRKAWQEFNELFAAKLPMQEAQAVKQGTYRILADKYSKFGAVGDEAGTQAQMALARGLREGIEDAVPGVGQLNAKESALINALELAERRAGVGGNKDIGGIAWLANNPQAALAMMADRSAAFKSWLANRLAQYSRAIPQASGSSAAGMYEASTQNP